MGVMKFLALVCILWLEQLWPLRAGHVLHLSYRRYSDYLEQQFNGLQARHGVIAWCVAVLPLVVLILLVEFLLLQVHSLFALLWAVAVLYVVMGFRRFSDDYNVIATALKAGDIQGARDCLGRWRGIPADELSAAEVARVAIELGLVQSHRYVLAPVFWFVLLGPVGPLVYRLADVLATVWGGRPEPEAVQFGRFAAQAFAYIDWLPARATALCFAIAGNFEDAVFCWRSQSSEWGQGTQGIILASGAGALGLRLGGALREDGMLNYRPELGQGADVEVEDQRAAVGLVWRSLVLWLALLLIVSLARAAG
jgi:adenosylcobinamide-phosphate synthase